jgi:hypothetical protein
MKYYIWFLNHIFEIWGLHMLENLHCCLLDHDTTQSYRWLPTFQRISFIFIFFHQDDTDNKFLWNASYVSVRLYGTLTQMITMQHLSIPYCIVLYCTLLSLSHSHSHACTHTHIHTHAPTQTHKCVTPLRISKPHFICLKMELNLYRFWPNEWTKWTYWWWASNEGKVSQK